ncbi:hypothetical protein Ocin01_16916 [Orchesella cincta]|uniref:NodB homology domain-containing protein n=1 Tax=Orchesella cincta TaxID=48709 RepID=A0A1D2M9V6_ORCCI|nr:hypothetical protein Ocin01_16916 [Orchesella cincta]
MGVSEIKILYLIQALKMIYQTLVFGLQRESSRGVHPAMSRGLWVLSSPNRLHCVFGGAPEFCIGRVMYSLELQTCDCPRNVYGFNNTNVVDSNLKVCQVSGRGSRSSATQRPGSAYAYTRTPIKIETIGQLRNAEEVGGKKLTRVEDEYTQRSGRSYEGSLPNYKEEIYQNQGSTSSQQQPYTRASVTRRPVPATQPAPTRAPSTRTRTRGGSSSSSGFSSSSSGSTRSRPTLKLNPRQLETCTWTLHQDSRTAGRTCTCSLTATAVGRTSTGPVPSANSSNRVADVDSVNDLNKNLYRDLFEKGRKNPNGCPISATFYVFHEWTDYSQVQNLAADGHEIASHSFGEQYSQKKWDREINGQREILAAYGGVKLSEVRGMRAPFLAIGGNNMFKMLHDSRMPVYENRPPSWPYTLDYRIFHDCMVPLAPPNRTPESGRFPWADVVRWETHASTPQPPRETTKCWLRTLSPHHKEGFEAFLDTLVQMDDVLLVTNWQALQWLRNPMTNHRVLNFAPSSCHRPPTAVQPPKSVQLVVQVRCEVHEDLSVMSTAIPLTGKLECLI